MTASSGKSLSEQVDDLFRNYGKRVGKHKTISLNSKREMKLKKMIKNPPLQLDKRKVLHYETIDGIKLNFSDDDWFLLRFSGTEPVIRCYAESESHKELEKLMKFGLELVS
jgi:phosphomannomutase